MTPQVAISPVYSGYQMTDTEWRELVALKAAIDGYPQAVSTCQQERFTELFVMSLAGKGNMPIVPRVENTATGIDRHIVSDRSFAELQ
jgi:hypothetical protein